MNPDAWKRLEQLVDQALDLADGERRAFLEGLGPEVRAEVETFLAAEEEGRNFLEAPVDERAAPLLEAIGDDDSSWDALQLEGETVGPYRVLSELGRGGMGAVFLAERADGQFDQRVALKLVKRGMDTADILDRFRSERQILARLQHENIARLLDGGVTESGQPYFAMEHVEGAPISSHSAERRLTVAARLGLFLQICEAVEYAHRNLVVHRDLKPSNVLVTREGQVKLLDFGIAKVLDSSGDGDSATLTLRGARPLTPQYAAPEQLLGQPVTTATDVYSLGVLLYELLSGRHPYTLRGLHPAEIERVVVKQEPEPPSSAVRRVGADPSANEIAQERGVDADRLVRTLRGDLDNIVRTALRKEPSRRYPSARALAEDVRRFLQGMPVSARPDTFGYRTRKFVARHRVGVAATALVGLSAVAGIVGTLWQARAAVREGRKAEEVKRFALSLFEVSDPDVAKGKEITARQLLERAVPRIQSELAGQPEIEAEMLLFVGKIDHRLGLDRESQPLFERALELRRAQLGGDDRGVAEVESALAGTCLTRGDLKRAEALFTSALEKQRKRLGDDHPDTAHARGLLGRAHLETGNLAGAENLLGAAIATQRRHPSVPPAELAANVNALGRVRHLQGNLGEAERLYREALDTNRRQFGEEHSAVSQALRNLAALMKDKGDVRGAETQYRALLVNDRRLFGPASEAAANDLNNLGAALVVTGEYREAKTVLEECLEVFRRLYGADSPELAVALHNLARALRCVGDLPAAETLSRQALERAVAMLGEDHPNVAATRGELARILCERGKSAEAESLARRAVATCVSKLPADHPRRAESELVLGHVLCRARRRSEAEPSLRQAITIYRGRFGDNDWRTIEARVELAECAPGSPMTSPDDLTAAYVAVVQTLGPGHPLTLRARKAADGLNGGR